MELARTGKTGWDRRTSCYSPPPETIEAHRQTSVKVFCNMIPFSCYGSSAVDRLEFFLFVLYITHIPGQTGNFEESCRRRRTAGQPSQTNLARRPLSATAATDQSSSAGSLKATGSPCRCCTDGTMSGCSLSGFGSCGTKQIAEDLSARFFSMYGVRLASQKGRSAVSTGFWRYAFKALSRFRRRKDVELEDDAARRDRGHLRRSEVTVQKKDATSVAQRS